MTTKGDLMSTLAESIKADADRSLARHQTYEVVERVYAIPGVSDVTHCSVSAFARVDRETYNRPVVWAFGDTTGETLANLEQAVRDAYMAVS